MDHTKLVMELANRTGVSFLRASSEELSRFGELGAPEEVVDFFAHNEPTGCVEISGARLWPIKELIRENR